MFSGCPSVCACVLGWKNSPTHLLTTFSFSTISSDRYRTPLNVLQFCKVLFEIKSPLCRPTLLTIFTHAAQKERRRFVKKSRDVRETTRMYLPTVMALIMGSNFVFVWGHMLYDWVCFWKFLQERLIIYDWTEKWIDDNCSLFCLQDTNIGVPVTMCVDRKGYFVYWHDQNQVRIHTVVSCCTSIWSQSCLALITAECSFAETLFR